MGGKIIAILGVVITVCIALVLAPLVMDTTHETVTDPQKDTFDFTTAVGETTQTLTLTKDHYHKDKTHMKVYKVLPSPEAEWTSWTFTAPKTVSLSGLTESTTYQFRVEYEYNAMGAFPGSEALANLIPLLFIVGVLALAGGMAFRTFAR